MELQRAFLGSSQDASFFYIPIPSGLSADGIFFYLILQLIATLEGELTTDTGQTLTADTGESLTFDNRNRYPELNLSLWREKSVNGIYEQSYVFINRELYATTI